MRSAAGVFAVICVLLVAAPALAVEATEVAEEVSSAGFYVEPGAEEIDDQQLEEVLAETGNDVRPVILAEPPAEGEDVFAEEVLAALGQQTTVMVVSPGAVRVVSAEATGDQVQEALEAAEDQVDFGAADAGEIAAAFARSYDDAVADQERSSGIGRTGALLVGGGVAAAGLVTFAGARRRRRTEQQRRERLLTEAREEVGGQISAMAEQILTLTDQVELADNAEASGLFNDATAAYTEAQQQLERSSSPAELERVSDELDHARWQLEAVAALLDGREPPPKPEREPACFFDPTHGAGTEEAVIETAAGTREVHVCSYDAAKLRAGETPEPRMIAVGGQQVPAPMAPRPYGGGGWGWLDDFSVILGGSRTPYGWGGYSGWGGYRPRRRAGGFGGGWGGGGWVSGGTSGWSGGGGSRSRGGGVRVSGRAGRTRGTSVRGRGGRRR